MANILDITDLFFSPLQLRPVPHPAPWKVQVQGGPTDARLPGHVHQVNEDASIIRCQESSVCVIESESLFLLDFGEVRVRLSDSCPHSKIMILVTSNFFCLFFILFSKIVSLRSFLLRFFYG